MEMLRYKIPPPPPLFLLSQPSERAENNPKHNSDIERTAAATHFSVHSTESNFPRSPPTQADRNLFIFQSQNSIYFF